MSNDNFKFVQINMKRLLYMAFIYLRMKAFDCVHQDFIWLAMPTLGTEEWLVHLVQSMYKDVRNRVGFHQGSVLSPFLFIIVLKALSRQFRTFVHGSCSMQMTMMSAESMSIEELIKLKTLKSEMAKKG